MAFYLPGGLLFPYGAFITLFNVFIGFMLGLAVAFAALVYVFFRLTKPSSRASKASSQPAPSSQSKLISTGRDPTSMKPVPPHPFAKSGRYKGMIFTASPSHWARDDIVEDWPPRPGTEGSPFKAWDAIVDGSGTLILDPIIVEGKISATQIEKGNIIELNARPRARVGVPLEGCDLEVVAEGLGGRDVMSRRGPILLSHATWNLLDGEKAVYIFAPEASQKQEWVVALGWWCQNTLEKERDLESSYAAYGAYMRDRSVLEYAQENDVMNNNNTEEVLGNSSATPARRRKRTHGHVGMTAPQTLGSSSASDRDGEGHLQAPAALRQEISIDAIMEARWMQNTNIPVPSLPPKSSTGGSPIKPPALEALSPPAVKQGLGSSSEEGRIQQGSTLHPQERVVTVEPYNETKGVFARVPGLPRQIAVDYGANAFLTRLGFDMLRSPIFKDFILKRIDHQVSRLKTPDFVQSLQVLSVDMGCTVPTLGNLSALPTPDETIWPQLIFDVSYKGKFTITLGSKVDIRDAPGWETLENVLDKVGGGGGSSSAGSTPRHLDNEGSGKHFIKGLREGTATKLRRWAENTASHISKVHLSIKLEFTKLEGRVIVWVPPPPGTRLFFSFLNPPKLSVKGTPELAGRLLKYGYHVSRANAWLESQMRKALQKNMVFPGGADIVLPALLGGHIQEEEGVQPSLPGLEKYLMKLAELTEDRELAQAAMRLANAAKLGNHYRSSENEDGSPQSSQAGSPFED